MREIILVRVTGQDRPGITAALSAVLARHNVNVLDIGQAVIHENLSWGMLIDIPQEAYSSPVVKELLFTAHELDLDIRFAPVTEEDYTRWADGRGIPRYIITLLARHLNSSHIAWISETTRQYGLNIDLIQRLSGRPALNNLDQTRQVAVEFWVRGEAADIGALRSAFLRGAQQLDADVAIQKDDFYRRSRRLVCFDMDSTLVQQEVIDELAMVAGVGDSVKAVTEAAMRGEISFRESFLQRVSMLRGLSADVFPAVAESLTITDGAHRLIATLKRYGYRIAILSGGFTYFAEYLQKRLDIDYVYANELEIEDGVCTGKVLGYIVDEKMKAELLQTIAIAESI
jgi:phosphoserine phosphatase